MNLKRIICATSWFMAMTVMVTAQTWSDVTNRFITNPAFNDNSNAGWTWESNASTQEVRVNCISFYNGAFDLHQQLKGLPRGTYRISVQGFYRTTDNNSAYNAYKNGTEDITAYLYAGQNTQKLTSLTIMQQVAATPPTTYITIPMVKRHRLQHLPKDCTSTRWSLKPMVTY